MTDSATTHVVMSPFNAPLPCIDRRAIPEADSAVPVDGGIGVAVHAAHGALARRRVEQCGREDERLQVQGGDSMDFKMIVNAFQKSFDDGA